MPRINLAFEIPLENTIGKGLALVEEDRKSKMKHGSLYYFDYDLDPALEGFKHLNDAGLPGYFIKFLWYLIM